MPGETVASTISFTTADGVALAGDLAVPPAAHIGVVLTHPHPRYGGDRHALVTDALFRHLVTAGVACLRFDFRGAGDSGGVHDGGRAEASDVVAALDALAAAAPGVALAICGYSFGADVAACVDDPRVQALVLVAPPLAVVPTADMAAVTGRRPVLVLVPEHDQFRPPASAATVIGSWPTTSAVTVPQADHFVAGRTSFVSEQVLAFLGEHLHAT